MQKEQQETDALQHLPSHEFIVGDGADDKQVPVLQLLQDLSGEADLYPDGGIQAWLVVLGAFIAHCVYGITYSFGIYNSYYTNLEIGNSYSIAMIGSIGSAAGYSYPHSRHQLPLLILTQGLMFGIGASFIFFPAVSLPAQYFLKRRGLAMGIAVSGTGCGGLVFSILSSKLLDGIGMAWTLRVTAIICLVLMMAVIPFMKTRITPRKGATDYSFLKRSGFYFMFFACFFVCFCEFVSIDFLTAFGQQVIGLSLQDAGVIMSFYNGFNILGRLVIGYCSDRFLGPFNGMVLCLWCTVVSVFAWIFASSFGSLAVVSSMIGFWDGGFWCLFPVAVAEMFGMDSSLVTMLATLFTLLAIPTFASPPISGLISDAYGMDWLVIYAGILAVFAAGAGTAARFSQSSLFFARV
ncbi:major facilitator superfamily domain-containing protein [Obelidium mucronatum]|nr:major facilitator superfamily domain-containing protein [Obelidium mucronatum]